MILWKYLLFNINLRRIFGVDILFLNKKIMFSCVLKITISVNKINEVFACLDMLFLHIHIKIKYYLQKIYIVVVICNSIKT